MPARASHRIKGVEKFFLALFPFTKELDIVDNQDIHGSVLVLEILNGSVFDGIDKTVDEFYADKSRLVGRDLRVAGWVVGDSIQYTQIDSMNSRLEFDIVDDFYNPGQRLRIVAMNEPMPDLLQNQAQALVEGTGNGSEFLSNPGGLFLKCPTRYEEEGVPATSG